MIEDSSPLSADAFRDALAKGLGRTMLALRGTGGSARHGDALIEACLENLQYDRQLEANRAAYLTRLVEAADLQERLLGAILDALPRADPGWDRDQMIDLLEETSSRGDEGAWQALRDLAAAGEERAQDNLGSSGPRGLEWVAEHVLPSLTKEERWRIWMWLPDDELEDVTDLQRRLRAIRRADEERSVPRTQRVGEQRLTPREFLDRLDRELLDYSDAHEFVKSASDEALREAAERFLTVEERSSRRALERVFREVRWPLPVERLFELVDDETRGRSACRVLGCIDHPKVRRLGLGLIQRVPVPWNAFETLKSSFREGDEAALWAVLPSLDGVEADLRHNVLQDLREIMAKHPAVDWQPFAEWIYEKTPCSFCRSCAVDWMVERGTLPERIRVEGEFDAEEDIRKACNGA